MFKKTLIGLFIALALTHYAQTYPSGITTTLVQPYTLFFDEYTNPLTPKIKATIVFTDFTEPSWSVYLKLKITGPNFTIESNSNSKPPFAINVSPGIPVSLSDADLDWYFNADNLLFSGMSRNQLAANNNRLPEGFYTFCFEVIDYETNKKISLPNCASAYLSLNDPPLVIAPSCGSAIENLTQQNILLQWQIANTNGNLTVSELTYQIDLYEVSVNCTNPLNAIINNQALPIWQSQPIYQNSYLYGIAEPPLEKGKRYVYTIKAIEQGKSQIKNKGFSQPCWFYYGYPEGGAINLIALPNNHKLSLSENGYFTWSKPNNVINATQMVGYEFRVSPLLDGQDEQSAILNNQPFFQQYLEPSTSNPKNFVLPTEDMMRLKRSKPYVWQVKGVSGQQEIAKSPIYTFTGPPIIEKFFAGNFEVLVTTITSFDSLTYKISGKGKIILNNLGEAPEFSFNDIYLNPIGNNVWVMTNGSIKDKIIINPYTLTPDSVPANKNAEFVTDSIMITCDNVCLNGFVSWKFPLGVIGNSIPFINAKRQHLILDTDFKLYSQNYNTFMKNETFNLLEPGGFTLHLNNNSQVFVNGSKYNLKLRGFVELPENVANEINTRVKVPFNDVGQLFFIRQYEITHSETIKLFNNTNINLKPRNYVFDFSENTSDGDFKSDSAWKGFYVSQASIIIPTDAEITKQISTSATLNAPLVNLMGDSTLLFVNQNGLTCKAQIAYNTSVDTLKFNTFPTQDNEFKISITDNATNLSHLTGKIQIPVLDTVGAFPYFIPLNEFGFGNGYLLNALTNYSFTFNAGGGNEQNINMTLTKALFKNNNRLEMDMSLTWPHLNLTLNQLQKFCAWGNGNIGFETPNGIIPLTYQANAKISDYNIQVERIGCGRTANLYSFGVSSRIILSDDISGENGAPIVNSYSIYKNPLLSGDFNSLAFSLGNDSLSLDSNGVHTNVANNLTTNLNQTLNDLGVVTSTGGNINGSSGSNNDVVIPVSAYLDMQKIVTIAETFIQFIDLEYQPKAQDYVTVIKQILRSDAVKKLINTSPEQLVNHLILEAAESIIHKINQPILNISNQATTKLRTVINTTIVKPITSKTDTLLSKSFEKIKQELLHAIDQESENIQQIVETTVNSVKTNLSNEIKNTIHNSIETNVTSKITGFVQVGVTGKITGFVRKEIKTIATNIIETGVGNSVNLNAMVQDAGNVFKDVGDTIADAIALLNFNTIKNTTENIADDIIKGISFERISANILNELASKGLSTAVNNIIKKQLKNLGGAGGDIANAIVSPIKFDFSNLGTKLKNGQINQIVKFDPTNIYITTKVADVKGQLIFTKADPLYGDSWQALVNVRIKAPNENKPISGSLKFITAKTTQGPIFSYWFFGGTLQELDLQLNSPPLTIDGFEGVVYHKMKKMQNPAPLPDETINYGIRSSMFLFDTPTEGKSIKLDVGLSTEFGNGNFGVQLDGIAHIGNYNLFSVATATGYIGYYSSDKRFQGAFGAKLNTAPLLCGNGEMGVKIGGANNAWEIYMGKKATPIELELLCKNNLKSEAYVDAKISGIEIGLLLNVNVDAESPWIGNDAFKIKGYAEFGVGVDAYTNVSINPSFKINDTYISAWANATIGFQYQTAGTNGNTTIAGVSLSGSLLYKSHERAELHGEMNGSVTILNNNFNINLPVHYDIDHKQRIGG